MQPGHILDQYSVKYLHLLLLKTTEKHSFLYLFGQNLPLFTIFCPVSIMLHACFPCLEYAQATWKIIEKEWGLNTSLGSLYLQKCCQSFRSFTSFLGFYHYSFTSCLWSDITLRKLIFAGINFCNIWSISRKLVPTKTIGKLLIREI